MASLARVKLSSILVLLLLLGQCAPVSAQEIGIEYGGMRAGYDDALERPTGLSGYIDLPLSERVAIRFSAAHYTESRTITRSPCMGLVPPGSDCASEPFDGNSSLTNYSAGLAVRPSSPGASLQLELYALGMASDVDATFTAQNGDEQLQPVTPDGLSLGIALGEESATRLPGFLQYRADLGCRCRGSAPVALMHGFRFASPVSCPSWLSEHAWDSPGFASERSPNLHDTSLLYIMSTLVDP